MSRKMLISTFFVFSCSASLFFTTPVQAKAPTANSVVATTNNQKDNQPTAKNTIIQSPEPNEHRSKSTHTKKTIDRKETKNPTDLQKDFTFSVVTGTTLADISLPEGWNWTATAPAQIVFNYPAKRVFNLVNVNGQTARAFIEITWDPASIKTVVVPAPVAPSITPSTSQDSTIYTPATQDTTPSRPESENEERPSESTPQSSINSESSPQPNSADSASDMLVDADPVPAPDAYGINDSAVINNETPVYSDTPTDSRSTIFSKLARVLSSIVIIISGAVICIVAFKLFRLYHN